MRKVPNFSNISSSEMLQTIQSAVRKTAAAGELLLREGDSSGSMLYIHAGNVAVSSGSKGFIAHIYQDNIVGHHSYIYNRPRTATVHAATENNSGLIYYEFHVAEAQHVPSDNSVRKRGSISPTSQSPIASLAPFSSSLEQSLHSTADAAHHSPSAPAPSRGKRSSMSSLPSIDEASRVSPRSAPPRRSVVAPGPGHAQLIATLSGANRAASSSGSGGGSPPASIAAKSPIFHVDVSEHHMWEEQQKSDEVARLNKLCNFEIDQLHEILCSLKLEQKRLQLDVAALVCPTQHIVSCPPLEAKHALNGLMSQSLHLTDEGQGSHVLCLSNTLSEMMRLLAEQGS